MSRLTVGYRIYFIRVKHCVEMAATHSKPVRRKSTVGLDNLEWVVAFYFGTTPTTN